MIADAYEADEAAAAAEYGAEFRRDIESFISREAVEACVAPGRRELPPISGINYRAFVDPSGGSQDSMTLAIAHRDDAGRVVLDALRERRPPFSPSDVVAEFATVLKTYNVSRVIGDRYAGEWPRERFREQDIQYRVSEKVRSDIYRDLLPALNSVQAELLDNPRLIAQLLSLERRTARSGRDSIDHAPGAHDDVINAAAGALLAAQQRSGWKMLSDDEDSSSLVGESSHARQLKEAFPLLFEKPSFTCGDCISRKLENGRLYCELFGWGIEDKLIACDSFVSAA